MDATAIVTVTRKTEGSTVFFRFPCPSARLEFQCSITGLTRQPFSSPWNHPYPTFIRHSPLAGAVACVSDREKKPMKTFIVRNAPKPYGKQQQVEGPSLKAGSKVAVMDDVATSGKSLVQAIEVLEKMGLKVVKAVCLVDRQEGAKEALAKKNCPLVSVFRLSDILS